jgi:NADH-quinone oxidoreductase subunit H
MILKLTIINVITFLLLFISIIFYSLFERKVLGQIQRRTGPFFIFSFGGLQSIIDGIKLVVKEQILVSRSNKVLFLLLPILLFNFSMLN